MKYYMLSGADGHAIIPVPLFEWAAWFASTDRIVQQDTRADGLFISTVFLGIDHSFGEGPPLLFETMVFQGKDGREIDCQRYSTWDDALAGHQHFLAQYQVRATEATPDKVWEQF